MNIDDFGIDLAMLAGALEGRLHAARAAGFAQVALQAGDLAAHPAGFDAAVATVRASGLRVTALQALRDFEGLTGPLHDYKVGIAKMMLEMCRAVGSRVLVASASALPQAAAGTAAVARDLRKLAMLAIPLGVRVAYRPALASAPGRGLDAAWDAVLRADCPNLGLCLDLGDALAAGLAPEALEMLYGEGLLLVQLAEPVSPTDRVLPGEGGHAAALAALVLQLDRLGYRGPWSLDTRNGDVHQLPADRVAARARRSADWLAQDLLRRAVPLPNRLRLRSRGDQAG